MASIESVLSAAPPLEEGENYTQFKIMISGNRYLAGDKYLCRVRDVKADELWEINQERNTTKRMKMYREFLNVRSTLGKGAIVTPFTCEYGFNISVGKDIFIGPNCTFLDVAPIYIGDRTMIGAGTSLFTPVHPLSPEERSGLDGPEWAKPIKIGNDCWLGGAVTVLPGVTIGDGVTVGAGSVVTKDVPSRCVIVGNPARVIKKILEDGTVVNV